ncbi:MAG TPA: hypothetical protein VFY93_12435 [Planctomycetota bacterium]|nr:hypothetical protein [Planctomycetota bacterium]
MRWFPVPLLLLVAAASAQDFARESIEMMPGLNGEQKGKLHRLYGRQEQIDKRLKENPPKEEADRLLAERSGGFGGSGLDEAQWKRLVSMPRGPLREERYAHMVVLEVAPALDRVVAATDAAQAVVVAQREQLLNGLDDKVMRARVESTCNEQQRAIERRFWRAAWHLMTPDQMRAARELLSPRYAQYPDPPQQLQTLPGLTPSQSVRIRALFTETESENAADLAEVRRIATELRAPELKPEERDALHRANGAAYGRLGARNGAMMEALGATLTQEQRDALHARPPYLGPGELGQPPWGLFGDMRLADEQLTRLKSIEQESGKARGAMRPPDMGTMMQEIGAESPQMMAVETARQGVRGQVFDHFREVGRTVFAEVLTPTQVCDWVVAPGVAP